MVLRAIVLCVCLLVRSLCWTALAAEVDLQGQIDALSRQLILEKDQRTKLETQVNGLVDSMASFVDECACGSVNTGQTAVPVVSSAAPATSTSTSPHPAFTAGLSTDYDSCQQHEIVKFNSVKLNIMNGYDPGTGIFTAPVAGSYAFTATLSAEPNNKFHVAIVKDAVTNTIAYLFADPIDLWLERSTTALTYLNAGDRVWMSCIGSSRIEGDHGHSWEGGGDYHSHFSGFLISAN